MTNQRSKPAGANATDHGAAAGMERTIRAGKTAMQTWMEIGAEAVRFVSDRLQQDIETQKAMLACKSIDEMRQVQAEFFRSAQEHYAEQARRMVELTSAATTSGLAPAANPGKRRYDDVPV